ncbi:MAG: molybdopterin-dependent oxidoreductase [Oscillospiraceae bacterium]|nr:molybdopterin-dependent oxidoreductase [Oscillospiraceae bacterium]MBQ9411849.1 molybdopterin-dependent oxidoreductase [Oscillospiraceae bacterium]
MNKESLPMTRRTFLEATAVVGAAAAVGGVGLAAAENAAQGGADEELKYVRTTCAPNCTGGCGQKACVYKGEIKHIIQAADYEDAEHNPRGCLKGLSFSNLIYGPERMTGPMIRTGPAGSDDPNDYKKVGWDEALDYTGRELRRIIDTYGPESVAVVVQVAGTGHVHKGAVIRLATLNHFSVLGGYEMNGDLPMSAPITFGVQSEELETYCWPDAKYLMVFGSNPLQTRIPDAHFLVEAKQNGAKLLVFDPCFTATAAKADEWYSIKPSTDAALALGFARVLINENLYDADFVRTYTDLPILIRDDNGKRLLAADVEGLEVPADMPEYRQAYVAWQDGKPLTVDPEHLELPLDVQLEGGVTVQLRDGGTVDCHPAFHLLKDMVQAYTPEHVQEETDMPADQIERIAREMAVTKPLHILYGASNYQWYHGDLKGRALSLLCALTGNIGHLGDGFSTYAGQYRMRYKGGHWWNVAEEPDRKPAGMSFAYMLNGPTETMSCPYPKHGIKAWIVYCCNPFDQHNMGNILRRQVEEGQLELVVSLDFQRTTSSKWAHVCLPGVSWYEKMELVSTPIHPYAQLMQPAIQPVGDCKPELWIMRELAERIHPGDKEKYFYGDMDPDLAAEEVIKLTMETGGPEVAGITLEELKRGPVKLRHENPGRKRIPFYEQIHDRKPFPPVSYPSPLKETAQFVKSGRIEFYKDEDMFLKLGEALPVHKRPYLETECVLDPDALSKYPFSYITRNSVHRVHSTHSNNRFMRELQDDNPKVYLNPEDAAEKGIAQGDLTEVYNGRGRLLASAVLDPGIKRKLCIFEEGWWSRYTHGTSYNTLIHPFINPIHEIYFVSQMWAPNTSWNECLVDVRKAVSN